MYRCPSRTCSDFGNGIEAHKYAGNPTVSEWTGSDVSLDQARMWLEGCVHGHQQCRAYYDILNLPQADGSWFRPKRLIEITGNGMRLHETLNRPYQYVTLSHRWPSVADRILRLTTTNLPDFLFRIPGDARDGFSQVFADAVRVCRHLSVRYLWIDSLCIIQDSPADWQQESGRMGDVYKHALFNVAAQSIEDGNTSVQEGMFRTRRLSTLEPWRGIASFDLSVEAWESGMTQIRERITKKSPVAGEYFLLPEDWAKCFAGTSLMSRGWVAQERILSPRIIHFTRHELVFECYENIASEAWSRRHPAFSVQDTPRTATVLQSLELHGARSPALIPTSYLKDLFEDPCAAWYTIAYAYAGTRLTCPRDKLIAISGLAKGFQQYIGASPADYLAGIWAQTLPYGLLWGAPLQGRPPRERIRPQNQYQDPPQDQYQAPTWSWASVNWRLTMNKACHCQPHDILVSIEDFGVQPLTDPFGQVEKGAYIRIKGTTYDIKLVWKQAAANFKPAPKFWAEVWTGTGKFLQSWGSAVFPDERYIEGETKNRDDLRVMPVLRSNNGSKWKWMEMLMLEPTRQNGVYRRFGIMNVGGHIGREWFELNTSNFVGRHLAQKREEVVTII
jgi:hypothetical protein